MSAVGAGIERAQPLTSEHIREPSGGGAGGIRAAQKGATGIWTTRR